MRALVVDDSKAMRMILRKALSTLGFSEVLEAGHGQEALDRLHATNAPELALVDWNMPVMNGLEFVTELRKDHSLDGIRVVMVTTETEVSQIEAALGAGANEYLMKPFNVDALREKLAILGLGAETPS